MGDLSIFSGFLQFLSSIPYSFHYTGLSLLLLSLSLDILGCCKWICFPISFLSLPIGGILVYWFFYLATLMKIFIMSRSFLVQFLGSFSYKIISSANRDSLTSSFLIWISSSCFISLSRNSKTMLSKSSKSRHVSLVPDFTWSSLSFFPHLILCWLEVCYI
jgi:hypothetical protein